MFRIHTSVTLPALAALASLLLLVACGDDSDSQSLAARNQTVWDSQGLDDYRFDYLSTGFAYDPNGEVTITVLDGVVADVQRNDGEPLTDGTTIASYPTIDALFVLIQRPDQSDLVIEESYDATLGYPTLARFQHGSEWDGFEAGGLVAVDPSCLDEGADCSLEGTLAASAAHWLDQDPGDQPYCVERSDSSFMGTSWRSWTEVVEREITYWRVTAFASFDDTVGETQEGTEATADPRVTTMDQLYARCRDDILTRPTDQYELGVELDDNGLLAACWATLLNCADDCTTGLHINSLTFGNCELAE